MNLKPLDDRIVVQPNEAEQTTASGLVIPDTAKEKPQQGKVLAVGPGKRAENTGELDPARHRGRPDRPLLEVRRHRGHRRRRGPADPRPAATSSRSSRAEPMAKILKFDEEARRFARGGRQQARRRRQGDARPEGPQRRPRQEVGRSDDHQRRCLDRQGGRARRPVREHGRPARQGSGDEDQRRRR